MSKSEILAELPTLKPEELAEIQARLDELAGGAWNDGGELTASDRQLLDVAIGDYRKSPDAGDTWENVRARIETKLRS